ncbi:MAG TPA: hypothetical protein VN915_01510 [Elusimicrobiota bacterium]|nr:hypothetical protein [Elusimicrobiota bacterium]
MIRPEVVQYLRDNLPKFSVEALRKQLHEEGVSDVDFEHCLADALRGPKTVPVSKTKKKTSSKGAKFALAAGVVLIVGAALFALTQQSSAPVAPAAPPPGSTGESGFVGADGWVVRLPKDYAGFSEFKDSSKTDEIVHFAKRGTDPTNFLDEGLYGEMGIVRLEVAPSQFPPNLTGAAALAAAVKRKTESHGEKYLMKNIQIGTLPGVQVNVQAPFPRVEAYILGQNDLYFFYGGQEDDIWRDIVLSLRDAHSEE